jgi:hypothetical protein
MSMGDMLRHANAIAEGIPAIEALRHVSRFLRMEHERDAPVSPGAKLEAWRRGFLVETYLALDLAHHDHTMYLNDFERTNRARFINNANGLFRIKRRWREFMLNAGLPQAETVALIDGTGATLFPYDATRRRDIPRSSLAEALVVDGGRYILKPDASDSGQGIVALDIHDKTLIGRRGWKAMPYMFAETQDSALIERSIDPHPFWSAIFPGSLNTLRVQTMWEEGEPEPFVAVVGQRFGTSETTPVDNLSSGGLCVGVDLETGTYGPLTGHPYIGSYGRGPFTHHPETHAAVTGISVPFLREIMETALSVARMVPQNPYIGFDIAVDAAGVPVVVEANGNSATIITQLRGGLLETPRVRQFFVRHRVVRRELRDS